MRTHEETLEVGELSQDRHGGNDWSKASPERVQRLGEDMEENGYDTSQPIIVYGDSNRVLDGRHRVKAAKKAGVEKVPAVVVSGKAARKAHNGNFNRVSREILEDAGYGDGPSGFGQVPAAVMNYDG